MELEIGSGLRWLLGGTLVLYLVGLVAVARFALSRVKDNEDFLVAGRRLPLSLAWLTILATWFGAGTLLAASDEVRREGLRAAALDPFGAGCCLLFAGLFVAAPLWRMNLLTVPDFFRRKFGPIAEMIASLILVPSYFGWIAAQFMALAGVLELFFGLPLNYGLVLVTVVGTAFTLTGGMWSVTLTDAAQIGLVMLGLVILLGAVLWELGSGHPGSGLDRLLAETPSDRLTLIPTEDLAIFMGWLGVFLTGALGNVPVQDLLQRVFAAKSARTSSWACLIAGGLYLSLGAIPLTLALAGNLLFPESLDRSILPALAEAFLNPVLAVVFVVALIGAIMSTITSALLAPSSVLAQNVLPRFVSVDPLALNRWSVAGVAFMSLVLAYQGEDAYGLLEIAYATGFVATFVPLMIGIYSAPQGGIAAIASMVTGLAVWGTHLALGHETFLPGVAVVGPAEVPVEIAAALSGVLAYFVVAPPWRIRWTRGEHRGQQTQDKTGERRTVEVRDTVSPE